MRAKFTKGFILSQIIVGVCLGLIVYTMAYAEDRYNIALSGIVFGLVVMAWIWKWYNMRQQYLAYKKDMEEWK